MTGAVLISNKFLHPGLREMAESVVAAATTSSGSSSSRNNNQPLFHQLNLSGAKWFTLTKVADIPNLLCEHSSKGHS